MHLRTSTVLDPQRVRQGFLEAASVLRGRRSFGPSTWKTSCTRSQPSRSTSSLATRSMIG